MEIIPFALNKYRYSPGNKHYEILGGNIYLKASPDTRHQRVSKRLLIALTQQVESKGLGEFFQAPWDVVLSKDNIIQPDILFVASDRAALVGERNLNGVPDLVIEILSAGSRDRDLNIKRKIYSRFGIGEYWIVDPYTETIEVLIWSEIGYVQHEIYAKSDCLASPLLPAIKLPVRHVLND